MFDECTNAVKTSDLLTDFVLVRSNSFTLRAVDLHGQIPVV